MNTGIVVVTVAVVVIVLIATVVLLRSIAASPAQVYRRSRRSILRFRKGVRPDNPDAVIRVDPDDWAGTSPHLGG
jgi:uncharacterized protein HemY